MLLCSLRARSEDEIFLIELDGPGALPRLTRAMLAELREQLHKAARVGTASAIVLTGTDKCFAAGADLAEVSRLTPLEALHFSALGQSLMSEIERSPKPIVAAIRGYCLGGGFDLALACHLRVAATDAVFGHTGTRLGIITGWGGTQRLARLACPAGRARVREALLASDKLTAQDARHCGLVHKLTTPSATLASAVNLAHSLQP